MRVGKSREGRSLRGGLLDALLGAVAVMRIELRLIVRVALVLPGLPLPLRDV